MPRSLPAFGSGGFLFVKDALFEAGFDEQRIDLRAIVKPFGVELVDQHALFSVDHDLAADHA